MAIIARNIFIRTLDDRLNILYDCLGRRVEFENAAGILRGVFSRPGLSVCSLIKLSTGDFGIFGAGQKFIPVDMGGKPLSPFIGAEVKLAPCLHKRRLWRAFYQLIYWWLCDKKRDISATATLVTAPLHRGRDLSVDLIRGLLLWGYIRRTTFRCEVPNTAFALRSMADALGFNIKELKRRPNLYRIYWRRHAKGKIIEIRPLGPHPCVEASIISVTRQAGLGGFSVVL